MKLGLIGYPLGHSWSPQIHAFFLKEDCYSLYELREEELKHFFETTDLDGFNVTIPYKQKVMDFLDEIDPAAKEIGAVNTVVHQNGRFIGYNTDYIGFLEMLENNGIAVCGKRAAVLGTGGVSKAIVQALKTLGADYDLVSRRESETAISYERMYEQQERYEILINATPVGMSPNREDTPVDLSRFTGLEAVVDVIANPLRTRLCFEAKLKGLKTCGGFEMLVGQALAADRYFTGTDMAQASVSACMDALLKERRNLVLTGMPTCGKSTIGKLISKATGRPLIEMDAVIEQRLGTTISECFAEKGEEYFRSMETALAEEIGAEGAVISCGGGIIKNERNMRLLSSDGIIFWIDRNPKLLFGTASRPLSRSKADIEKLYKERKGLYELYCDFRIDNNGPHKQAAEKILAAIGETL